MTNNIGINHNEAQKLINQLNDLLANYQIFYMNVRGFHWNIKGQNFFELHIKFEELYNDLLLKVDEIAERILTLGGQPDHDFSTYIKKSDIIEKTNITDGLAGVKSLLDSYKSIIMKQRIILKQTESADDEGTGALMSDYIREEEKLIWMLSAYLG